MAPLHLQGDPFIDSPNPGSQWVELWPVARTADPVPQCLFSQAVRAPPVEQDPPGLGLGLRGRAVAPPRCRLSRRLGSRLVTCEAPRVPRDWLP